jgi:hypothetical protein
MTAHHFRAMIGSILAARMAGIAQATNATTSKAAPTTGT